MDKTVIGVGIACMIAAIVGGGVKLLGTEIPAIGSTKRQVMLFVFGFLLAAVSSDTSGSSVTQPEVEANSQADPSPAVGQLPPLAPIETTITWSEADLPQNSLEEMCDSLQGIMTIADTALAMLKRSMYADLPPEPPRFVRSGYKSALRLPGADHCDVSISPASYECLFRISTDRARLTDARNRLYSTIRNCLHQPPTWKEDGSTMAWEHQASGTRVQLSTGISYLTLVLTPRE
jgi:hypothetical protein